MVVAVSSLFTVSPCGVLMVMILRGRAAEGDGPGSGRPGDAALLQGVMCASCGPPVPGLPGLPPFFPNASPLLSLPPSCLPVHSPSSLDSLPELLFMLFNIQPPDGEGHGQAHHDVGQAVQEVTWKSRGCKGVSGRSQTPKN